MSAIPGASTCPHPAVPLHAKVTLSNDARAAGTVATYHCDDGYQLFGSSSLTCTAEGKWRDELPYCAVNVAYGKPAHQSSTARGGDAKNANDGDTTTLHENKYCSESKVENSPWWQVDLLQPYQVRVVRVITRGCCGHQPLRDLEIRVGNSSHVQGNRLCAWYPGTLDDGISKDLTCAYPINGRFVYIQMVGVEGSLSLCEVQVFTPGEFSTHQCANQLEPLELTTFNRTCYEFQVQRGGSFEEADKYCQARGGLIVHRVNDIMQRFLAAELERLKEQLKSKLVWLGVRRDQGLRSRTWHWVNHELVTHFLWAEDQPNNYNGQQNCVVLDGGRKWLWNDVTCDLDYLPWICQYTPSKCGSPDRKENSTVMGTDYRLGQSVTYQCPVGNKVVGDAVRRCGSDGYWTGIAPSCKYVDCGSLPDIENGRVNYPEDRTTYNATVEYVCRQNYTLSGNGTRMCQGNGKWNGSEPSCQYEWCQQLPVPHSATVDVNGFRAGSKARYTCAKGHRLIGDMERTCQLGGKWSGDDPICKFVDCGEPDPMKNGAFQLVDGMTTFQSKVRYTCRENYTLEGPAERSCQDTGLWSGDEPKCELISCGEPDLQPGSYFEGTSYTIHSEVEYRCEPGHRMFGEAHRKCGPTGEWSGSPPTCKFIDCGRVPPILKGEASYANGTTYLGSLLTYSCISGYRLGGAKLRYCMEDGRWSGTTPKCEEIRCIPPEVPRNATIVFGGNDRASTESFKVGSTVQYRCMAGHIVKGESLRTCNALGAWSELPPMCTYIDCGLPRPVPHGRWLLASNATYYGTTVEYECDRNFELLGPARRLCLENSTWSSVDPVCQEVSCGQPDRKDNRTAIAGSVFTVGGVVTYSCGHGYKLIGNTSRICASNGRWTGSTPFCELVDCSRPTVIANGRGFLVNGTTSFGSKVEYECLPDFRMIGEPTRTCLASGEWSGQDPKCTDIPLPPEKGSSGERSDGQIDDDPSYSSKTIGISVAIGAGALLIIIIVVAVVCMKTRKPQPVKDTENVGLSRPEDKDIATVTSYSRFSLDAEANNGYHTNGAIRHNPNGLVTFSSNPQPIYANVTVNGQSVPSGQSQQSRTLPARPSASMVLQAHDV